MLASYVVTKSAGNHVPISAGGVPVCVASFDDFETDLWYEGYVAKLKQDDLNENIEFVFTDGTLGRMSREEMLAHVVTHGGYARAASSESSTSISAASLAPSDA